MNIFKKILLIVIAIFTIVSLSLTLTGCPLKPSTKVSEVTEETTIETEEKTTEERAEETTPEETTTEETEETKLTTEEEITIKEEQADKESSIDETNEEYFLDLINKFFNAVVEGNEYKFFSTSTKKIVGTEEEYKKGINVDWHFIIVESHSSWENLKLDDLDIDNNTAIITIIGDRIVEGLEYKNDKVSFKFVKENNEWKMVFPSNE